MVDICELCIDIGPELPRFCIGDWCSLLYDFTGFIEFVFWVNNVAALDRLEGGGSSIRHRVIWKDRLIAQHKRTTGKVQTRYSREAGEKKRTA